VSGFRSQGILDFSARVSDYGSRERGRAGEATVAPDVAWIATVRGFRIVIAADFGKKNRPFGEAGEPNRERMPVQGEIFREQMADLRPEAPPGRPKVRFYGGVGGAGNASFGGQAGFRRRSPGLK
jgi:hypothetical protein